MGDDLRDQIFNSLNARNTNDLIEIWKTNDHVEWSDPAFEAIRRILIQRLGELPPQNEPITEYTDNDEEDVDDLSIRDEDMPVFYRPKEVLLLEKWLPRAAIATIAATFLTSLFELPRMQNIISVYFFNTSGAEWAAGTWGVAVLVFIVGVTLQSILLYYPLKALGSILRILMQMEFNSRGVKSPENT